MGDEERAVGLIARTGAPARGVHAERARAAIPLVGVRIKARVNGPCVEVEITQRYRNVEAVPVEAVYVFPLDDGSAVCGFDAIVGDSVLRGEVLEREQAFERYDDALSEGDGAFLLEQERPNVFTASVGNLRPDEQVQIRLRYVALLPREDAALRLSIPTVVAPRYVPHAGPEVGQPAGERVNPPLWTSVPYGLSLQVDIAGRVRSIDSPSHAVRTVLADDGAQVTLSHEDVALDRDFVLLIEPAEAERPFARVTREADGRRVALVHFMPEIAADERGREIVFLLDCSGSMEGTSIEQARRALALCIRALGEDDTFNVVRFGSEFESLWKRPKKLDDRSLAEASAYVARVQADLGGTELDAPLASILAAPVDKQRERRVLLLTDGQVSNEDELFALARRHPHARVFALGIGEGASAHLVRGIARASRGAAEMIFPGERIEPKVMRTFARMRTPALGDVAVGWGKLQVEQAPDALPPLFAGDSLTLFARIGRGSAEEITLTVGEQKYRLPLDLERAPVESAIPTLWARERIRELEEQLARAEGKKKPKKELIALATRYRLSSSATSFVAIEERAPDARADQPAELRRIPIAVSGRRAPDHVRSRSMPRMTLASAVGAMLPAPAPMSMSMSMLGRGAAKLSRMRASSGPDESDVENSVPRAMSVSEPASDVSYSMPRGAPVEADRVFDLLMTQGTDGRFARSGVLDSWLTEPERVRLEQALQQHDEAIVVTALVIALLARDASDREAEWRPAVTKASAWLKKKRAAFDAAALLR